MAEGLIYPWIGATDILGNDQFIFTGTGQYLDEYSTLWSEGGYQGPKENWSGGTLPPQPDHTSNKNCVYASEPWGYNLITYKCIEPGTFICEKY